MAEFANTRHEKILRILSETTGVSILDLSSALEVSEMTIRRDLQLLQDQGLLLRVHGGAIPTGGSKFAERLSANTSAKKKAVAKLHEFVPGKGLIYIDGSTTILNIIGHMRDAVHLQVATSNVETYTRLKGFPCVEPILLGGRHDPRTDNLVGPLTVRGIMSLVFERAFMSAWGMALGVGPTELTIEDAEIKELIASRTEHVYLAIDESKFTRTGIASWNSEPSRTVLATSHDPANKILDPYRKLFKNIL